MECPGSAGYIDEAIRWSRRMPSMLSSPHRPSKKYGIFLQHGNVGGATKVKDKIFSGLTGLRGFLIHLRSRRAAMNQKTKFIQSPICPTDAKTGQITA
jgi:hypothetical protein